MKRRSFIKSAAQTSIALPFVVNGFRINALGSSPLLNALSAGAANDHVLVLIQLGGGNDGLNTVIPLDIYSVYQNARPTIAIPQAKVLKMTNETGLHPAMTGMNSIYQAGKMRVVQSVGYPTPNFSHFRSTDIWLTGAEYYESLTTGWAGRFLDTEYPGYPIGYPNAQMPDPLAIQIGTAASTGLEGPNANMSMIFSDSSAFYELVGAQDAPTPPTRAGKELKFIRDVNQQLEAFGQRVKTVAAANTTVKSGLWPVAKANTLADQLKIVAQLISGGLKTRIYMVSMSGFDTHASQGAETGTHATLLTTLSAAVQAFQDEMKQRSLEDRVVGMTFSEFGRRIKQNGSGTDHGAAAPLFVFGSQVIPGILGANPSIPTNPTVEDNVPMQYDFRSIYASLLKDWFKVPDSVLTTVLYKDYPILPIIKGTSSSVRDEAIAGAVSLEPISPNPVSGSVRIRFRVPGGHAMLGIFDNTGRLIGTPVDRVLSPGEHIVTFDASVLPGGIYYYRLQSGGAQKMMTMTVAR